MKANAKNMRSNTKEILNAREQGDEVVITCRGKSRAKIIHIQDKKSSPLFGIWRDYESTTDVDQYVHSMRKGRFDAD